MSSRRALTGRLPVALAVAAVLSMLAGAPVSAGSVRAVASVLPTLQAAGAGGAFASTSGASSTQPSPVAVAPAAVAGSGAASFVRTAPRISHAIEHIGAVPAIPHSALNSVLNGGLAQVAAAAQAGTLTANRLSGFISRSGARGPEVGVSITAKAGQAQALAAAIVAAGGHVANHSGDSVDAYVPASSLAALASASSVRSARPILRAVSDGLISQGVAIQGADVWQSAGITGAGVKVGIIDGGFQGIASHLGTELPATIQSHCYTSIGSFSTTLSACDTATDHGTAVAETTFAMAPGASLYIADPLSLLDYQQTVTWMTSSGVKIINVSQGFSFEGPGDGSDPGGTIYTILNQAVAAGALWVNSAGNAGTDGWVGPWVDSDSDGLLDFAPGDEGNTFPLSAGDSILVTMRWNDPWGASANDYDLYLYGPGSTSPIASSTDPQTGSGDPVETLDYTASVSGDYYIGIAKHPGAAAKSRIQLLLLTSADSALQYETATDTLPSPADSANPGMLTVGAVAYNTPTTIEPYSSRGPTVDNRTKPDLVAVDCAATTVTANFCGTSQSAPYTSGAAALVLQANPTFTAAQLASFLIAHASALGTPSPNSVFGAGRLSLGPAPVTATTAIGLAFQVQPTGAVAGSPITAQPVIKVVDMSGATVTTGAASTSTVTLALGANPGAATLTCDGGLSKAAIAGIVTFTNCAISAAGTGYTIVASATSLAPVTSLPFDVATAVPQTVVLVFQAQPTGAPANAPFATQPVINVTDGAGHTWTTGAAATATVTLALSVNPSGGTLSCTGGLTKTAVAGVATFAGCFVTAQGTGYTITASVTGGTPATSNPFDIAAGVVGGTPTLTLSTTATAILWGTGVTLTAQLGAPSTGGVTSGRTIHLQSSLNGTTWANVTDLTTDASGSASLVYRPVTNLYYQAVLDAAADLGAATSAMQRVTVRQLAVMRPDNAGRTKAVSLGTSLIFTTTVRPDRIDVPPGRVTFQLYLLVGSTWKLTQSLTVTPDSLGRASVEVTFRIAGKRYIRSMANPTGVNANSFWTPIERYDVN